MKEKKIAGKIIINHCIAKNFFNKLSYPPIHRHLNKNIIKTCVVNITELLTFRGYFSVKVKNIYRILPICLQHVLDLCFKEVCTEKHMLCQLSEKQSSIDQWSIIRTLTYTEVTMHIIFNIAQKKNLQKSIPKLFK